MNKKQKFGRRIILVFGIFISPFILVRNLFASALRTNDENIEILLKDPKERALFDQTVDDLLSNSTEEKKRTIKLNGRDMTISI